MQCQTLTYINGPPMVPVVEEDGAAHPLAYGFVFAPLNG
jgi:hypothetical protein